MAKRNFERYGQNDGDNERNRNAANGRLNDRDDVPVDWAARLRAQDDRDALKYNVDAERRRNRREIAEAHERSIDQPYGRAGAKHRQ
jgi:hypothetical protein